MRCVIISGSPDADIGLIAKTVRSDDYVVCADRGLRYAEKAKIKPNLIVGDFDSYRGNIPLFCDIIKLDTHKDDTDTAHCVKAAMRRGFKDFLILSSMGGRLDHTIANIALLMNISENGGRGELLSKKERVVFLKKGSYSFDNMKGLTFSLFPFGCDSVSVTCRGVEYPLESHPISADVTLGVSNVFLENKTFFEINNGNAIIVINLIKV